MAEASLQNPEQLYNEEHKLFYFDRLDEFFNHIEENNYSMFLIGLLRAMLLLDPLTRVSWKELADILYEYETEINNFETFTVKIFVIIYTSRIIC